MLWVLLSLFMLCVGAVVLDGSRLRELLPAGAVGIVHSGMVAGWPFSSPLFRLSGSGPVTDMWAVLLLLQVTAAPVITMWYAQGLPPQGPPPVVRTALFLAMQLCLSAIAIAERPVTRLGVVLLAGHLSLTLLLTWKVHHYCTAPTAADRKGRHSLHTR